MLATDGHFSFVASQPQLACAVFVIAEPDEVISLELHDVSIDCTAGNFIKVGSQPTRSPQIAPTRHPENRQLGAFHLKVSFDFNASLIKMMPKPG